MERRTEYVTAECPEYNAAGLDLIQAELTIVTLVEELERLRDKYALACAVIRRQQERIAQLENR